MKVPKMYKSSDRYNAGTDVIYDDDSKLQYAPFIYAGVTAKDNGSDEEGEDVMIVGYKENGALDKNWEEIMTAMKTKVVLIRTTDLEDETVVYAVQDANIDEVSGKYTVISYKGSGQTTFISDTSTGELFAD